MKKFLIDGFPRNEDNLQGWNRAMEGKADVKCVLFFECTEDVSMSLYKLSRKRLCDNGTQVRLKPGLLIFLLLGMHKKNNGEGKIQWTI